jgi:hypothetical protein
MALMSTGSQIVAQARGRMVAVTLGAAVLASLSAASPASAQWGGHHGHHGWRAHHHHHHDPRFVSQDCGWRWERTFNPWRGPVTVRRWVCW